MTLGMEKVVESVTANKENKDVPYVRVEDRVVKQSGI